ncbi:hypothetical protein K466DRAFT_639840 [Polyporus arcularius HHB13444]|uniref:Uncharacterized protein n=1 Tax=Polyporus arcularius HHB13444 TaxID=1314778 RepID=A0A5C3P1U1_9APHY|nr:hypothetical protein K466DRAFT_639840 [Polyporus arcularius HHB13444]
MGSSQRRAKRGRKHHSPAKKAAIARCNEVRHSASKPENKENLPQVGVSTRQRKSLSSELKKTRKLVASLSANLEHVTDERDAYRSTTIAKSEEIVQLQARVKTLQSLARVKHALARAREKARDLEDACARAERAEALATKRDAQTRTDAEAAIVRVSTENHTLKTRLSQALRLVRGLQRQCKRFPDALKAAVERAKTCPAVFKLKKKGVYTPHACALARVLIRCGCSQRRAGEVVQLVGKALGISVIGRMSPHTIRRIILEGGFVSDQQTAFEILHGKAFTISSDATSNRHVDYISRFAAMRVPVYKRPLLDLHPPSNLPSSLPTLASHSSSTSMPSNRFLGAESTLDHTSERQVASWKGKFRHVADAYNSSPMAHRNRNTLTVEECLVKLKGVGGDHAADQLKTTRLLQEEKQGATYHVLAQKHLQLDAAAVTGSSSAASRLTSEATSDAIRQAGGVAAWDMLSSEERDLRYAESLHQRTVSLGKQVYDTLPGEERRALGLFLRLGCAMHKDLNSFKGGNMAMMAEWSACDLAPPILLANKDNAATLRDVDTEALAVLLPSEMPLEGLSAAELRALTGFRHPLVER